MLFLLHPLLALLELDYLQLSHIQVKIKEVTGAI